MGIASEHRFQVLHALRIKGFAKSDVLSDLSGLDVDQVDGHLAELQGEEHVLYREARALWQLSPKGREHHGEQLAADVGRAGFREALEEHYENFLKLNEEFKALCGDWQLRDGAHNDHSDEAYDKAVVERLLDLDGRTQPIVTAWGGNVLRFSP